MRRTHLSIIASIIAGTCAAILFLAYCGTASRLGHDFTWPWVGVRLLLDGQNPYTARPLIDAEWSDPLYYPMPALLPLLPLGLLPVQLAGAVFVGISVGLMAWSLPRHLWPILLSAPCVIAARSGQWGPLLVAAMYLPWLRWAWAAKPSVGAALWASRPSWHAPVLGAAIGAVGLLLVPTWPRDWLANLGGGRHGIALLSPLAGPVIAVGLALVIRRRGLDADVRLVGGLAVAPHILWWYDHLPLLTLARTERQAWICVGVSWAAYEVAGWLGFLTPLGVAVDVLSHFGPALYLLYASSQESKVTAASALPREQTNTPTSSGVM